MSPSRAPIRRLDPLTVQRIAAGEVVERPASVVKELVENSVDAEAGHVSVRIERGGLARIEVSDDGRGIPPDELELALERHATSKLDPDAALDRIATLGFRGEALASIASVARLRLVSRIGGAEAANGVESEGGAAPTHFELGRSVGTSVEVRDLFYNTPARRKFLHSAAVEQLEVVRAIEHLYLARPAVALTLVAEGSEIADFPSTRDLRAAAASVLGAPMLDQSFSVDAELPQFGHLTGVLGRPTVTAGNGRRLFLAVNGRTVESRPIAQATRVAFQQYTRPAQFPMGVLHLEIPLDRVDVNVHPTKREVRFARESELAEEIRRAVRRALEGAPSLARLPDAVFRTPAPSTTRALPGTRAPREIATAAARTAPAAIPPANAPGIQRRLTPPAPVAPLAARKGRPQIQLLGVLDHLYWVGTTPSGFVLIDQHAASERLLYEALLADGRLARQTLMDPITVDLGPALRAALAANAEAVREAGFELEPFGGDHFRVRSVPSYRGRRARPEALRELLEELAGGARPAQPDGLTQRVAASVACHAAIRAGDPVPAEEIAQVLEALYDRAPAVYSCPHGRPIIFDLPRSRLDRWFLRSGVGP